MAKIKIIFGVIIVWLFASAISFCILYYNKYQQQKIETDRYQNNFYQTNQQIDSLITSNGDYRYTVNSLRVNLIDLSIHNKELTDKLKNSNLKIKNLENIVSTQSSYIIGLSDSLNYILSEAGIDSMFINGKYKIFDLQYKDKWLKIDQKIKVSSYGENLTDYWNNISVNQNTFQQELNNDFDIVNELIYGNKKWWQFWKKKKVTGIKSHIITDNPYLRVKVIESYKFVE